MNFTTDNGDIRHLTHKFDKTVDRLLVQYSDLHTQSLAIRPLRSTEYISTTPAWHRTKKKLILRTNPRLEPPLPPLFYVRRSVIPT